MHAAVKIMPILIKMIICNTSCVLQGFFFEGTYEGTFVSSSKGWEAGQRLYREV